MFAIICLAISLIYYEADYYKYCLTSKSYVVSTGIIDYVDEYEIKDRGNEGFIMRRAVVSYDVDGKKYRAFNIRMSYKENNGSIIQIAINKNDPTKILRNEFLPLSRGAQVLDIACILFLLYNFIKSLVYKEEYKKKKHKRVLNHMQEIKLKKQYDMELQTMEKRTKLLHIMKNKGEKNETEPEKIKECMMMHDIQWNIDWLWCLNNLYPQEVFLLGKEDGEYKFITLTLKLREQGLPSEYYVIGQEKEYFYCCRCDSMRVYTFSKSLGITNTPYADIYDYLIKLFEKENNDEI